MAEAVSLISIAKASISLAATVLRPRVLQHFSSDPDTTLRILYNGRSPAVDIICVPDLDENPLTEWTKKDDTSEGVNWMTDLLPISLPATRILLFEYAPKLRTPEGFTRQTIHAQAYELLNQVSALRKGAAERRPLLFLTQSHGALIVRSAIFQSSASVTDRDSKLRSIYLSTGAVLIIDPHPQQEELSQSWKDVLEKAMSRVPHPVDNSESKNRSVEWFEWQQDRFRAVASTVATTTVVIRHTNRRVSISGRKWLDAAIAYKTMKFLGDRARVKEIQRDNIELLQFGGVDDIHYKSLLNFLTDSIEVGEFLSQAKWDLESTQNSLTGLVNDRWVKEAEEDYEQQLEKSTSLATGERTGIETTFISKTNLSKTPTQQRQPSSVSVKPVKDSKRSAGKKRTDSAKQKSPVSPVKDRESQSTAKTVVPSPEEENTTSNLQIQQDSQLKQLKIAETSFRKIEEVYGFLHAHTLESLNNLATKHIEMEMLDTAESIMQRLLVSWHQTFGLRSRKVLQAIQRIAAIKVKQRRYADASAYLSKAVDIRINLLKDAETATTTHSQTPQSSSSSPTNQISQQIQIDQEGLARCQIDLAISYDMQERFCDAEPLYREILLSRPEPTDPCRLLALENQALHWRKMGKVVEAARNYEVILEAYESKTPHEEPREVRLIESKLNEAREVLEMMKREKARNSYF